MAIEKYLGKIVEHLEKQEKDIFAKPVDFTPEELRVIPNSVSEPLKYKPEDLRRAVNQLITNDLQKISGSGDTATDNTFFVNMEGKVMTVEDILNPKTVISVDSEQHVDDESGDTEIDVKVVEAKEDGINYQELSDLVANQTVKSIIALEIEEDEPIVIGGEGFEGDDETITTESNHVIEETFETLRDKRSTGQISHKEYQKRFDTLVKKSQEITPLDTNEIRVVGKSKSALAGD